MNFSLALGLALLSSVGATVATVIVAMGVGMLLTKSEEAIKIATTFEINKLTGLMVGTFILSSTIVWFLYFFIQFFVRGL